MRSKIVERFGKLRLTEGRISGGFQHAELRTLGEISPRHRAPDLVRDISVLNEKSPTAEGWGCLGILQLLSGQQEAAIVALTRAVTLDPTDPNLLSDLSEAYIESARKRTSMHWILAVEMADRALNLAPKHQEALFNRALALQHLKLLDLAKSAWSRFLLVEQNSGWGNEGLARLQEVNQLLAAGSSEARHHELEIAFNQGARDRVNKIVSQEPRQAWLYFRDELLSTWAEAVTAHDSALAAKRFVAMRVLADSIFSRTGDPMARDVVDSLERRPERQGQVAAAALTLQRGLQLYQIANYPEALAVLQTACHDLQALGVSLAQEAQFHLACAMHYTERHDEALALFAEIELGAARSDYHLLEGEALWMEGLSALAGRDPILAQEAYRKALIIFHKIGDQENVAGIENLIAELLDFQGADDEAWVHRFSALWSASEVHDSQRLYQLCLVAAIAAHRQSLLHASLELGHEALIAAMQASNPAAITTSCYWLARSNNALGRYDRAGKNLQRASAAMSRISSGAIRDRLESDLLGLEAQMGGGDSLAKTNRAIDLAEHAEYLDNLAALHFQRAKLFHTSGRYTDERSDLEEAIDSIEEWRRKIEDWTNRSSFMERERDVFDTMITLEIEKLNRPDLAWAHTERLKGRSLLDMLGNRHPEAGYRLVTLEELEKALSENVTVLAFHSLPGRLCSWVVERQGAHFGGCRASGELEKQIKEFRESLQAGRVPAVKEAGGHLYDCLIRPLHPYLRTGGRLVIVPDGALYSLPFGALVDAESGRYLIELHALNITPSAGYYAATSTRVSVNAKTDRLVVVADAEVDRRDFPNLPDLRQSLREAQEIQRIDRDVTVLSGSAASREPVLQALQNHRMAHFAVHALANAPAPAWSFLQLSGRDDGRSGALFAWEISRLELSHMRLVFLSNCDSGKGGLPRAEGVDSLGLAFISAGVPSVVETLWQVGDEAPVSLVSWFYQEIQRGKAPVDALRSMQVRAILGGIAPKSWAAFEVMGV